MGEAVMVYIKSLSMLQAAVAMVRTCFHYNAGAAVHANTKSMSRLVNIHANLGRQFVACFATVETCKTKAAAAATTVCTAQLVYAHALQLSRDAAVKELLGQQQYCLEQYIWAKLLLETIQFSDEVTRSDRATIEQFVQLLCKRIRRLR